MAERLHEQTETRCGLASLRTESTVVRQRARKTEGATHLPEDRRGVEPHSLECRRWRAKALAFTVPPGCHSPELWRVGSWAPVAMEARTSLGGLLLWERPPPCSRLAQGAHSGAVSGRQA